MTRRRRRVGAEAVGALARPDRTASLTRSPPAPPAEPIAQGIPIPPPGEPIAWSAALRVDLPDYVGEQIREACHRMRCTQVALVLRLLRQFRDVRGRPVFCIRDEDLVPDRRRRRT